MATKVGMNVQSFPRPPLLERTPRHLQINWNGQLIADTKEAFWVLETHHPPTYYLPTSSLRVPLTQTPRSSYCEWKGSATYYSISSGSTTVANRIWSYESPTKPFEAIKGHLSFYAGPWDCYVDGEKVEPQPGDFYGGWVTSDVDGIVKGRMGNFDPV
ncbi:Uu.00g110580.m01.CDS01 [Anthostomella pinea]|uniref:Uu.00g110580.m01.CDS01 n=1 Tax=Anthostomella pinea TaxID=933095 RepID=A0AAI8VEY8_9PEZI|nr:Uu.00g110580.m01.CDS01 [Anthostomella pinea]